TGCSSISYMPSRSYSHTDITCNNTDSNPRPEQTHTDPGAVSFRVGVSACALPPRQRRPAGHVLWPTPCGATNRRWPSGDWVAWLDERKQEGWTKQLGEGVSSDHAIDSGRSPTDSQPVTQNTNKDWPVGRSEIQADAQQMGARALALPE